MPAAIRGLIRHKLAFLTPSHLLSWRRRKRLLLVVAKALNTRRAGTREPRLSTMSVEVGRWSWTRARRACGWETNDAALDSGP